MPHRLSGIGFKILLDILATAETPLRVKEFPLNFAAPGRRRKQARSTVVLDFLAGLYDKWLGRIIPTRFALFGTVGAAGVVVHMAVLSAFLAAFGGNPARASGHRLRDRPDARRGCGDDVQLRAQQCADLCRQAPARPRTAVARLAEVRRDMFGRAARQCWRCRLFACWIRSRCAHYYYGKVSYRSHSFSCGHRCGHTRFGFFRSDACLHFSFGRRS